MDNRIVLKDADAHIQAYMEYRNLVGDTRPLNDQEYQSLKQKAQAARNNELYVTWRAIISGLECKNIGPSSHCFCGHRYRDHCWYSTDEKRVSCRIDGCRCLMYNYVPIHGSMDLKCTCKHSFLLHHPNFKRCSACTCGSFISSFRCSCGASYSGHDTVIETREERISGNKPFGNVPASSRAACGGITDMVSLLDGMDRLAIDVPNYVGVMANDASGSALVSHSTSDSPSLHFGLDVSGLMNTIHKYART